MADHSDAARRQLLERAFQPAERPDPRRPRREVAATLRVRAELKHTKPPVWRRLDLDSSLMLDELHAVLQAAFGFTDSHLHRFAVGPSVYDDDSALYLCRWDVEDGETDGVDEREVRLDELLAEPGDGLLYTYDFGDDWEIALELEKVLERDDTARRARCVDGRRGGPPEDCGGHWGFEELVAAGEWNVEFDLEATDGDVQHALEPGHGMPPLLAELYDLLPYTSADDELPDLVQAAALDAVPPVDVETAARVTGRHRWLVERLGAEGVRLTSAGHLPPALVLEITTELRLDSGWIGKGNRENHTPPVANFRRSAQALGLVRKTKGQLSVPAAARRLAGDPLGLWDHLVTRLPLGRAGSIDRHACLLALLWTAAVRSVRSDAFREFARRALTDAGWRTGNEPLTEWQVWRLMDDVVAVLEATGGLEPWELGRRERDATPDGVLLARTVLARR